MIMRARSIAICMFFACVALQNIGCAGTVGTSTCRSNADCATGETCLDGSCMANSGELEGCSMDADCDIAAGESCVGGVCSRSVLSETGDPCQVTTQCPMDQYCNSASMTCEALLEDWCREASQCDASMPLCSSADPGVPGHP